MASRHILIAASGIVVWLTLAACVGQEPSPGGIQPSTDGGNPDPEGGGGATDADARAAENVATPHVAVGTEHTCALARDGSVHCWGSDRHGELGFPTSEAETCPAGPCSVHPRRVDNLPPAILLAMGDGYSCALDVTKSVWCWGRNKTGQLGHVGGDGYCTETDGSQVYCNPKPVKVDGLPSTIASLATGGGAEGSAHACARTTQGDAYCWGANKLGQCGRPPEDFVAVGLVGGGGGVVEIASDAELSASVRNGQAYTWGLNYAGTLGRPHVGHDSAPGAVVKENGRGALANVLEVRVGTFGGLLRTADKRLHVWGGGNWGTLMDGNGRPVGTDPPHQTVDGAREITDLPPVDAVDFRDWNGCLIADQKLYCWGRNDYGQCGLGHKEAVQCAEGTSACVGKPKEVALPGTPTQISVSGVHSAVLLSDGQVVAWGLNASGQLGVAPPDGGPYESPSPVIVPGLPSMK